MEKEYIVETDFGFKFREWHVICSKRKLLIYRRYQGSILDLCESKRRLYGPKLLAGNDEGLEKVIFDTNKKTVSVEVSSPRDDSFANDKRTADLNGDEDFFEYLQNNLDKWMMKKGEFTSVTPNEDRTVFEVK